MSLSTCLAKAGPLLSAKDRTAITELAKSYEAEGRSEMDAARSAVAEQIKTIDEALQEKTSKDQTDTPEFKRFYGDSKLVDAAGKPIVMYHGTSKAFTTVNMKKGAQGLFWMTSDKAAIEAGDVGAQGKGAIMPLYAAIKNPAGWKEYEQKSIAELKRDGYDGIILPDSDGSKTAVIFDPTQVKSADNNNGDFDATKKNITQSKARDSAPEKIFGRDIAPLAIKAYANLSSDAKNAVDGWNMNWHTGVLEKAFRSDNELAQEVRAAFKPVRAKLREIYGDTIPMYRGEQARDNPSEEDVKQRALLSWTPVKKLGEEFSLNWKGGLPKPITDLQIKDAIEQFDRTGHVKFRGLTYAKNSPDPAYYNIYDRNRQILTDGDDLGTSLRQDQADRSRWISEMRDGSRLYFADVPVDDAIWVPTGVNLTQPEIIARYNPRTQASSRVMLSPARPEFYSQLERAIEGVPDRLATMAAPQWKLWLDANAGKLGVKKDEIEFSGVKDYLTLRGKDKVTREEIAGYLGENGVKVKEVVLGEAQRLTKEERSELRTLDAMDRRSGDDMYRRDELMTKTEGQPTKYANYTVPGGTNYREVLITLPKVEERVPLPQLQKRLQALVELKEDYIAEKDAANAERMDARIAAAQNKIDEHQVPQRRTGDYKSSHFDQPNILAHLRVDDRTDADGKKVLFVNELQSDWGQDGKKKGFKQADNNQVERAAIKSQMDALGDAALKERESGNMQKSYAIGREIAALDDQLRTMPTPTGVPSAPFVQKTEAWVGLAIKHAIMHAASNGYDKVAFINGEQAAGLYDLSQQVDTLSWARQDGKYDLKAKKLGETDFIKMANDIEESQLADYVGKDIAKRIVDEKGKRWTGTYSGVDLKVGGEGMKAFYDTLVPQVANDVLKKLGGGKMGGVAMGGKGRYRGPDISAEALKKKMDESADPDLKERIAQVGRRFTQKFESFADAVSSFGYEDVANLVGGTLAATPQLGFTITPAMREKVSAGVPLFSPARETNDSIQSAKDTLKDDAGKPLTLYHGGLVWDTFESSQSDRDALWLTPEVSVASGYADQFSEKEGREIKAFHVTMAKPLDLRQASVVAQVFGEDDAPEPHEMARDRALIEKALKYAKDKGYDGLIHPDSDNFNRYTNGRVSYAVFNKDQLQLAPLTGQESDGNTYGIPMRGAKDGDNAMLSPARDQTETPAFKKWFGDSKVVDGRGAPVVVYHGTDADFDTFSAQKDGHAGFHFGNQAQAAKRLTAKDRDKTGLEPRVMPVYLSIQNPLRMSDTGDWSNPYAFWDAANKQTKGGLSSIRIEGLIAQTPRQDRLSKIIAGIEELGYDGIVYKNRIEGDGDSYIAFQPTQIKSAIGNNGDFDPASNNITESKVRDALNKRSLEIVGETSRTYTPEQLAAMRRVGFQVEKPSIMDRYKSLTQDLGKRLAQGIFDQFAPIKDLDKHAYTLTRLAKGASGAFEVFLRGGKLKLSDGVYDFDDKSKGGVVDKLLIPLQGEHQDFLRWIAANRAERLTAEGKENLFTAEDIEAFKTLAEGQTPYKYTLQHGPNAGQVTTDRNTIYRDSLQTFNDFGDNVLNMAEESGLIDGDSRQFWEQEFYVPFYRVADEVDGGIRGMGQKGSLVRQEAFKKLKGGKNALNADLLDNTLMNWAHLLDASAKNRAAKATLEAAVNLGVAVESNEATVAKMGKDAKVAPVWFMDGGNKRYFLVEDPMLMSAISSLEYAGMRNPVMDAMSTFKHVLTVGVTASPFFKIRNLIRDSVQVIGTSPIGVNPAANVAKGWALTNPKSDAYFRLLAGGGTIHFGTMLEGSEAKRIQSLVASGVDDSTILNNEGKIKGFATKWIKPQWEAYNALGNRGEAVNRATLYDQLTHDGMSHADASLLARDMMDFSMQGSFTSVRFLTQVLPFFNARLQGLYKLGRAAQEDPKRMAAVTGAVAMASLTLLALYGDDDDWKKREEWDRNNFWWFKVGGVAFRIPKPFEIGAIGTLAERGFELMFDKEMTGKRFRSQVLTLLSDNLAMNPVPQVFKPMLDIYANKDSLSGRPIENMAMQRLKSEYRFTDRTTMLARGASTALNTVTGTIGKEALSPVQIDQMLRGYFGWLGAFAVGTADVLLRPATSQPTQAKPDLWKMATGNIISDLRDAPSRYVSQMYEQAKELEAAHATYRMLLKTGKPQEAAEFKAENDTELKRYKGVENVKQAETKLNLQRKIIERDTTMSAEAKREAIRKISESQNRLAQTIR